MSLHTYSVFIVAVWFIYACYHRGQFNWLWFSVILWIAIGLFSAFIMPNVLGITHLINFYPLHTYLLMGSIFVWLNQISPLPKQEHDKRIYWQARIGTGLTLFMLANLVLHIAFLIISFCIYYIYPNGISIYTPSILLQLYLLQPLTWWVMVLLIMLIFYLHRRIQKQSGDIFSLAQIKAGILLGVIIQFAYVYYALVLIFTY